ncbi:MAG: sulfurtransferase FdhD [Piscirickettsiaceae bacterium]|nr:MAG: sulfurtransferase FdhD [Piscirickettsiaceae bacterium]
MTDAGIDAATTVQMTDEYGITREGFVAAERPLTIYVDKREVVTLMTMGSHPELLILGWLKNQRFITELSEIRSIQVDWQVSAAAVTTFKGIENLTARLAKRTVTTGCGQGTVFGGLMDDIANINLPTANLKQSDIYTTLKALTDYNDIYRRAGAVHGCALSRGTDILKFVEDVGRHNAVDTIAGHMWLDAIDGSDTLFYTTGRLTSEMVIKVAQMGIPILLSRSGTTQMGLELAQQLGVILIARAKGRHFLIYNGLEHILLDEIPR